jgi:hypothetical protein
MGISEATVSSTYPDLPDVGRAVVAAFDGGAVTQMSGVLMGDDATLDGGTADRSPHC